MKTLFGVPGRLVASLVVVVVVAALAVVGTLAYFSGTNDQNATLTTATISIGSPGGFPMSFANMLPGETNTQTASIKNTGNRAVDLYFQLMSTGGGPPNLCLPTDTGTVLTVPSWWSDDVCKLYPGWSGSTIAKIDDNLAPGATTTRNVSIKLPALLGNSYQGLTLTTTVHLIAVQHGAPAPQADTAAALLWPAGDPNYP